MIMEKVPCPTALPTGCRRDDYEISSELSDSGLGITYIACDHNLGQDDVTAG
jgi:hypothetical protein